MADPVDGDKEKGTGDGEGKPISIEIEVGGEKKTVSAEDVGKLIEQQAGATQKAQKVAAIEAAAKKYNMSAEDYVGHAEGAFAIGAKLVEDGIIDEQGEIIKKEVTEPSKTKTTVVPKPSEQVAGLDAETIASLKTLGTVTKALEGINERMGSLEEDQASLIRGNLQVALKTKHKELNDEDCSKIFGISMEDRKKSLWDHAKDYVGKKVVKTGETRAKYAKEFGIEDLAAWDANKLKEQGTGGGAAMLIEGKKVMFGRRKSRLKDKDAVTPKAAMIEYMKKQGIK